jgi:hypothetical protein
MFIGKKFKSFTVSFCTIGALAAINYTLIHNPLVFVFTMMLLVHELGHYLIAKLAKADASYPFFIPLPFIGIGITRVKNLLPKHRASVAIAGVLFSALFILNVIFNNFIYHMFTFSSLFVLLFLELFFNYFGSDGNKYRQSKLSLLSS